MDLKKFLRRLILGAPLLVPAYGLNLAIVFVLNSVLHLGAIGIISTVVVGDLIAYAGNVALAPYILLYLKRTKYFTKSELEA